MHYSRIMPEFQDKRYLSSTAVLMNELIKFAICSIVVYREQRRLQQEDFTIVNCVRAVFGHDAWKLTIPAALYTVLPHSTLLRRLPF